MTPLRRAAGILLVAIASQAPAAQPTKLIKEVRCTGRGAQIVFEDQSRSEFPAAKGYRCVEAKLSADRKYAGWKFSGEIVTDGNQQRFPDATVHVLIEGKSRAVTENSRYIPDWSFVPGRAEVFAETSFEHGPSTYVLYDLKARRIVESCGQFELDRCPRLRTIVQK